MPNFWTHSPCFGYIGPLYDTQVVYGSAYVEKVEYGGAAGVVDGVAVGDREAFPGRRQPCKGRSQIWWRVRALCGDSEDVARVFWGARVKLFWGARVKHQNVAPHPILAPSFFVSLSKKCSMLIPLLSFLNQCHIS
ncbi:hypothetical protein AMTRI_Chr01g134440 [Amborella trichopoda]